MFGWEYVPDWFIWFAAGVMVLFIGICEWFLKKK